MHPTVPNSVQKSSSHPISEIIIAISTKKNKLHLHLEIVLLQILPSS